ncbi:MAG TPA: aldehyde dehydrogenase family protein [Leucothrix mucor]|nr:aldehyde dehydrogenase family protein [Leucothrix mucor]
MDYKLQVPNAKSIGQLAVTSPYDGSNVGSVETIDLAGVDQALKNATALFDNKDNWLSAEKRITVLRKMAVLMEKNYQKLVDQAVAEGGKPIVDTRIEMDRAIDGILNCIECIRGNAGREIPMHLNPASANRIAFTHKEPIGVVVAVSAFNHPINLIIHQIGPAIASGCPVIIKPASDTALSAFALAELFSQAGLPEGWCQAVMTDSNETAQALVTDERVSFFSFIGSAKIGWMLKSKLAAGTRCALEHGGAAPVIITEDADLDDMMPLLAKAGFYHAGQVCVSVQRIFAHHSIAKEVATRLAELGNKMQVGDPADENIDIGPLIRHWETDRVEQWVNEAIKEGAELISGGQRISEALYPPTVLFEPETQSKVRQLEIFGPVVCINSYSELDEAITSANAVPYSFQASVVSKNIDTAMYAFKHLNASAVMINDHTAFRVDWMPFAGLKQSGYGVGGIPYTFDEMQIEKLAVLRSAALG